MNSKDEMDKKVQEMIAERSRLDAELRRDYGLPPPVNPRPVSMSGTGNAINNKEQLDRAVRNLMEERRRQEVELRSISTRGYSR